jgi:hypothetical protein
VAILADRRGRLQRRRGARRQGLAQRPPRKHWWRVASKGPVRTVTLAVLDAGTGKTVAWSSIRVRKGEPAAVADLLVAALQDAAKG